MLEHEVGMSKSGLDAHFQSKLELQLATIEAAQVVFDREVVEPTGAAAPGAARVIAPADGFLSHVERGSFPAAVAGWIEAAVREAQALGEVAPAADPGQLAFETNALLVGANLAFPLFGDPRILERARVGVRERLRSA